MQWSEFLLHTRRKEHKLQHMTFHCIYIEKLHLLETSDKGQVSFTTAENDQSPWQQILGMRQSLIGTQDTHSGSLYSTPLNSIAPGYSSPMQAYSPVSVTFLHWSHEVSGSLKVFSASIFITVPPVLNIFSTDNSNFSFYSKINEQLHLPCCWWQKLWSLAWQDSSYSNLGQLEESSREVNLEAAPKQGRTGKESQG